MKKKYEEWKWRGRKEDSSEEEENKRVEKEEKRKWGEIRKKRVRNVRGVKFI